MSAPEPRANPDLLGHTEAEATILDSISTGRMHHAWLITGPGGRRQGDAGLPLRPPPARRPPRHRIAAPGIRRPGVSPRRRQLPRRPADHRAGLQRKDQADEDPDRRGGRAQGHRLHVADPRRGRLARRHRRRRGGDERRLRQRPAEDPGGTAAARHPAAGLRRPGPPAAHHPQPLPPPAPGTFGGRADAAVAVALLAAARCRRTWPPDRPGRGLAGPSADAGGG